MYLGQSDDLRFFDALINFTHLVRMAYSDDFSQGFIRESEYQKLLHKMLESTSLNRLAGFGNINVGQVVISEDKLYIDKTLFKRESDDKMSSPYAVFIRNSNKPVRYYNYYCLYYGKVIANTAKMVIIEDDQKARCDKVMVIKTNNPNKKLPWDN